MKDDKGGDETTDSVNPLVYSSRTCSLYLTESRMRGLSVSDMSTDTMKENTFVPACETQLNNALLVYKAIRDFEVGTSPSPNAIPTMVLKHPRKQAINFSRKCLTSSSAGSSPTNMDTLSRELYTERKKEPRLVLVLADQKSLSQS